MLPYITEKIILSETSVKDILRSYESECFSALACKDAIIEHESVYEVLDSTLDDPELMLEVIGEEGFGVIINKHFKPATEAEREELETYDDEEDDYEDDCFFFDESAYNIRCYKLLKRVLLRFPAFVDFIPDSCYRHRRFIMDKAFWNRTDNYVFDKITN